MTLRVCGEVCSLRTKKKHRVIRAAFVAACNGKGFRIIDWSIQGGHLHVLVEARDLEHLSRGMQGFSVRVARGLNSLLGRRGAVFVGRYFARALRTPREVRNAKAYILNNHRRHAKRSGPVISAKWVDKFSSWAWTDGWRDCPTRWLKNARAGPEAVPPVAEPRTWLLRVGWRRHGLVSIAEVPCGLRR